MESTKFDGTDKWIDLFDNIEYLKYIFLIIHTSLCLPN